MAKIIPIDVIKGISGKYGNKSSDYFATNRSSNQIHLAKIVNPYQGPPTEKQKAQQAKFAARQGGQHGLTQRQPPLGDHGREGHGRLPVGAAHEATDGPLQHQPSAPQVYGRGQHHPSAARRRVPGPPTQDGGGSSAGGTKRRHTITLTSANPDQGHGLGRRHLRRGRPRPRSAPRRRRASPSTSGATATRSPYAP